MRKTLGFLAVLTACALAAPLTPLAGADPGLPSGGDRRPRQSGPQTSDGVRGPVAPYVPAWRRTPAVITQDVTWPVAPGVTFRQWDQVDARGPIRASLLTLDITTPGLAVDYASSRAVRRRDTVRDMIARDGAIAGINGDFYDIGDTGAPLGLGVDRERGLLHARKFGWNRAFTIKNGAYSIANVPLRAKIVQRPHLSITNYNSPTVMIGKVGLYDYRWGVTAGYRVVDGQRQDVRQVVIRHNRVVENSPRLSSGQPIRGIVLVGRGPGAAALATLRKGSRARIAYHLRGRPDVAISGNKVLLLHGVRRVVDDREMHPRTAIGIDSDTGRILMLVLDGRQSFSRGYTMVELADLMQALGADDALNLDGGGSSTLLGLRPDGIIDVLNSPSDGFERHVANGLEVTYTP